MRQNSFWLEQNYVIKTHFLTEFFRFSLLSDIYSRRRNQTRRDSRVCVATVNRGLTFAYTRRTNRRNKKWIWNEHSNECCCSPSHWRWWSHMPRHSDVPSIVRAWKSNAAGIVTIKPHAHHWTAYGHWANRPTFIRWFCPIWIWPKSQINSTNSRIWRASISKTIRCPKWIIWVDDGCVFWIWVTIASHRANWCEYPCRWNIWIWHTMTSPICRWNSRICINCVRWNWPGTRWIVRAKRCRCAICCKNEMCGRTRLCVWHRLRWKDVHGYRFVRTIFVMIIGWWNHVLCHLLRRAVRMI